MKAAEIARNAFGPNHIWTSELYLYMALMYEECSKSQLASPWIRKSFMACYKAVGINHKAIRIVFAHMKLIEYNIGSSLANVPIEFAASKIRELDHY